MGNNVNKEGKDGTILEEVRMHSYQSNRKLINLIKFLKSFQSDIAYIQAETTFNREDITR